MARPRKFDYDDDAFYDEIAALAMRGATNKEIASKLEDKFGESLNPDVFGSMIHGNYAQWTKEENERRSTRLNRVLARARENINLIVRHTYLQTALGRVKSTSKSVTTRHMIVDGEETDDQIVQTTETEMTPLPNIQAMMTWMMHHDEEWRNAQLGIVEDASDVPSDIEHGISIDAWIKERVEQ